MSEQPNAAVITARPPAAEPWYLASHVAQALQAAAISNTPLVAVGAGRGRREEDDQPPYRRVGRVAVIDVVGLIVPRASVWAELWGWATSHATLRAALNAADGDDEVDTKLLAIDSPGGQAYGMTRLAKALRASNEIKPLHAHVMAQCFSGGYFLASQARRLTMEPDADIGSIGVIMLRYDYAKMFNEYGIKPDPIATSDLKWAGMLGSSLTKAQRKMFQEAVDETHRVFKVAVAEGRKLSFEAVEKLADARIRTGRQGVVEGFADAVMTLDEVLAKLNATEAPEPPAQPVNRNGITFAQYCAARGIEAEEFDDEQRLLVINEWWNCCQVTDARSTDDAA